MLDFDDQETFNENGFAFTPVMSGELFRELVAYPVIVEAWDKRNFGRARRQYQDQLQEVL